MDKRILIAEIAKMTNYAQWEVNKIVDTLFEEILKALENGDEVKIPNFGKFTLKYHKSKVALHPKNRLRVQIPHKASVVFKATRMFKPNDVAIDRLSKLVARE